MRQALAASIIAAGLTGPAAAQTDPIELKVGWRDCLALFDEYLGAYTGRGGEVVREISQDGMRTAALTLEEEVIVLRCKKTYWSAEFSIDAAPL